MKLKQLDTITRHWSISGSVPNPNQKDTYFSGNFHIGVEAISMEDALLLAREAYPDANFSSCNCRGDIHLRSTKLTID